MLLLRCTNFTENNEIQNGIFFSITLYCKALQGFTIVQEKLEMEKYFIGKKSVNSFLHSEPKMVAVKINHKAALAAKQMKTLKNT